MTVPEQYRIQTSQIFLYVQGAELSGKIVKYRYRMKKMKKTKVFGGNKLNKHWAADVQQGAKPGIRSIWRFENEIVTNKSKIF